MLPDHDSLMSDELCALDVSHDTVAVGISPHSSPLDRSSRTISSFVYILA